jgi:uncharacterized protein
MEGRTIFWVRLVGGLIVLYAVLQGAATWLGSTRGEWGLAVSALTLGAALVVQRWFFARSWRETWTSLGLGTPRPLGIWVALAACVLMLLAYPFYLFFYAEAFTLYQNAFWLSLGIFAQAGIAEEVVFRGFLYGNIRKRHTFWRAALLSMAPFALVHLTLFATMDWPIALTALIISVLLTFPFAYLYDLAGRTIWAPAIAHAFIQGAVKMLVVDGAGPPFPVLWMGASVVAMALVFLVRSSADSRS